MVCFPVILPNRKSEFTQLATILFVARLVGGKTRNIAVQFVLQQFCKTCCMVYCPSSETQGQLVGSGEKEERKFSGAKEPLGTDSHRTISETSSGWRLLIGHKKMLCIIVPNRRTVSPEFFSWVRTRRLLSRHTCPVRSPSLCVQGKLLFCSNQKRRNYRWIEKNVWDAISRSNWIWPEYSVFEGSQCIVNNRKFKMRGEEKVK